MPEVTTAAVLTSTVASQKIPVDMDEEIRFEETGSNRFELMTRMVRPIEIRGNMKTEWMEMALYPNVMQTTGVGNTTTVPVDHPEYAHRDQLVMNMTTGEIYLMNEDIGGTGTAGSITVVNHTGSGNITTATAAGQVLLILPEVHAEGEATPPAFSSKPDFFFTYLQQSDETVKVSDLAQNQDEYGMQQFKIDMKNKWLYRKRGVNLSLLISKPMREVTSASGPRRHTAQGLRDAITSHKLDVSSAGGSLDLPLLGEYLRYTTDKSSSSETKICYAGQNAMAALSALPMNQIQTTVSETVWGKKLTSVITPFGTMSFTHDRVLTETYGLGDVFIITDPKSLIRLQYKGCPERMVLNVNGTTDFHNMTNLLTGTWGLKVVQEDLNAWVYGIR